jgi:hypothetical protein
MHGTVRSTLQESVFPVVCRGVMWRLNNRFREQARSHRV